MLLNCSLLNKTSDSAVTLAHICPRPLPNVQGTWLGWKWKKRVKQKDSTSPSIRVTSVSTPQNVIISRSPTDMKDFQLIFFFSFKRQHPSKNKSKNTGHRFQGSLLPTNQGACDKKSAGAASASCPSQRWHYSSCLSPLCPAGPQCPRAAPFQTLCCVRLSQICRRWRRVPSYPIKLAITSEKPEWSKWLSLTQLARGNRDCQQVAQNSSVIFISCCLKMWKRPSRPASGVWQTRLLLGHIWTDSCKPECARERLPRQPSKVSINSLA